MGATPVPLRILLVGLEKGEEFQKLEGMGHLVIVDEYPNFDMIVGPRCWRLLSEHMKFLPLALKEARAHAKATRPKKVKKGKS